MKLEFPNIFVSIQIQFEILIFKLDLQVVLDILHNLSIFSSYGGELKLLALKLNSLLNKNRVDIHEQSYI